MVQSSEAHVPWSLHATTAEPTHHSRSVRAPRWKIPHATTKDHTSCNQDPMQPNKKINKKSCGGWRYYSDVVQCSSEFLIPGNSLGPPEWGWAEQTSFLPFHPNYCQIILISLICRGSEWFYLKSRFKCLRNPLRMLHMQWLDFPGGTSGKESPASAGDGRDTSLIPESGRSAGGGNGNPLHSSCLGNPMGRETWRATVHGVAKSWTRLSMHAS